MITLLCNISDNRLRITLLCKEEFWENKYFATSIFININDANQSL